MNYYFIAILILNAMGLGISLEKDGKPKEGKHNFVITLISCIIQITLIYFAIKKGF